MLFILYFHRIIHTPLGLFPLAPRPPRLAAATASASTPTSRTHRWLLLLAPPTAAYRTQLCGVALQVVLLVGDGGVRGLLGGGWRAEGARGGEFGVGRIVRC